MLCKNIYVIVWPAGAAFVGRSRYCVPKLITGARLRRVETLVVTQSYPHDIDHRVLHGHFDMLAFASRVALLQSRQDTNRHMHAGAGITNRRPDISRRIFWKAGDAHRATHGLCNRFETLKVTIGTIGAETLDRRIDQARINM